MSAKVGVNENIILQNYMLERLLERISISKYKYKFVLKGGMLITAIVGIDMRNTLDMDATIKGFNLEKDNLENILDDIFKIDLDDDVTFEFKGIKERDYESNSRWSNREKWKIFVSTRSKEKVL